MSSFTNKKNQIPETVTGEVGSAKRNIIRKGGAPRFRKEDASGQIVDDGTTYDDPNYLDENDPNYDSEEDTKQIIPRVAPLSREDVGRSKMTLTAYKKLIQPVISEFFVSSDVFEVVLSLQEIDCPEYSYEFVKRLINGAIDRTDHEREQVSQLLSELFPDILSSNMIGKGFERLFEIVDEIEIDAPLARSILSSFLARAVIDEVLPPSFLADSVICNLGGEIVDHAKVMLSVEHAGAKLEKIWGPGDGRPVEELKVAVDQILMEYILSMDIEEVIRCLNELHAPQFFHEIVKRAVVLVLDKPEQQRKAISELFAQLAEIQLMTITQAEKGFNRLYYSLPDLILDSPNAGKILDELTVTAIADKVLSSTYKKPEKQEKNA